MRRIRVTYNDPDKKDSSSESDDDVAPQPHHPKRPKPKKQFIKDIVLNSANAEIARGGVVGAGDDSASIKKKQPGVRMRKSGRWTAEIKVPTKLHPKRRMYMGTFDTFEEASDVFNKKRIEIDLLIGRKRSNVTSNVEVTEARKGFDVNGNELELKGANVDGSKVLNADDAVKVLDHFNGNASEGSDVNVGIKGRDKCSDGFEAWSNVEVVDMYGRLLPEYSWLDEELWFCKPEEEQIGNTRATKGCHHEFDWYYQSLHESKPCSGT